MCKFTVCCPLCSNSSFSSIASLRTSLIKAIDSPIKCPICHDIVIGLDKLTLHLISHNGIINMTHNNNSDNNNNNINDNNIRNNKSINNNNHNHNITTFGIQSNNSILINTNKNKMQLQQQQQQQQQQQENHISENANENLNLNTPAHAFYFKNEPIKFITPIILTPEFLHNTAMSTLTSSSSISSSISSPSSISLSRESHMIPATMCSNITQTNHSNKLKQQQNQNNIFNSGTTVLHLKQSNDSNLHRNLIFIENDSNLIKTEQNGNLENNNSPTYSKLYFNTQFIEHPVSQQNEEHRCHICEINFTSIDVFKKHVQIMHQIPLDTNDTKSIVKSTSSLTSGTQGLYQCHLCSKSYKIKARLRLHLKVKHCLNISTNNITNNIEETNENLNIATKLKICEKINTLTTNLKVTTNNLDGTNIKIEPFELNNDLKNQNILDQQNNIIKIEPIPKPWKCDICSKFYTTKYFLKKHKRIHTGETPYKCNICNKSFTFQQSYHKHLLYHSDDKPHVCKICNRAFKELSTLHNHERIHSGEKPFECDICGKRFRQRVSNYVHQRTHTGAKPYTCELCSRKFRYKVTLRTHKCTLHESLLSESNIDELNSDNPDNIDEELNSKEYSPSKSIKEIKENLSSLAVVTSTSETITTSRSTTTSSTTTTTTATTVEDNLQKLLQNVEILPVADDHDVILENSISNNLICNNYNDKDDVTDINKEKANKSIDELVAESCNKLGIATCNSIEETPIIGNDTPSPSEQLQHLCLYSPNSIEQNLNVNLNINDDSFKQLLFEIENSKHS